MEIAPVERLPELEAWLLVPPALLVLITPLVAMVPELRLDEGITAIFEEDVRDDRLPIIDRVRPMLAGLLFAVDEVRWTMRPDGRDRVVLCVMGDRTTIRVEDERRVVRLVVGFDERELEALAEVRFLLVELVLELVAADRLLELVRRVGLVARLLRPELLLEFVAVDLLRELARREGLVARERLELLDRDADRRGFDDDRLLVVLREDADDDLVPDERDDVVLLLDDFRAGFLPASATAPKTSTTTQASETSPVIRVVLIVAPPFAV